MEKQLDDKEIMAQLLDAIGIKAYPFANKMDNVSKSTIYNILKGVHGISLDLIEKITETYPNVNVEFLKKGIKPIFIDERLNPTVHPIVHPTDNQLNDVLSIPYRITLIEQSQKRIEDKLDQLINKLNNLTNL